MNHEYNIDEKIDLVPFNPDWLKMYKSEANRIKSNLEGIYIQHIGSTSIPNINAKPIIDIMIGINDWENREPIIEKLIHLGYVYFGEANVSGRLYFRKRNNGNFNLAVCQYKREIWVNNILFRDYLRQNSEIAKTYSLLKETIFRSGINTLLRYSESKHSFIDEILQKIKRGKVNK